MPSMVTSNVHLFQHKEAAIRQQACDHNAKWISAFSILDEGVYLGADNSFNLLTVNRNIEEPGHLEVVGKYYLGDFINGIHHGSLDNPMLGSDISQIPTLIFGTVNGAIGVVASLPQKQLCSRNFKQT